MNIRDYPCPCVGVNFNCSNRSCGFKERRLLPDFNESLFNEAHQSAITDHALVHVKKPKRTFNTVTLSVEEIRCSGIVEPRFFVFESQDVIIEGKGNTVFAICSEGGNEHIWYTFREIDITTESIEKAYGQAIRDMEHEHKMKHGRCSCLFLTPLS